MVPRPDSPCSSVCADDTRFPLFQNRFFRDVVADQKRIWTSPLHLERRDWYWLTPLIVTEAVLIREDQHITEEYSEGDRVRKYADASEDLSDFGSGYMTFGATGVMYAMGRIIHDTRLVRSGSLAFRAEVNAAIVTSLLKVTFRRERPMSPGSRGNFFVGGSSFPSGHSASIWAMAAVLNEEYRDVPLIRYGSLIGAVAVSASRFTGRNHFTSDIVAGSAIGYLIGRLMVRKYDPEHEGPAIIMKNIGPHQSAAVGVSQSF